MYTYHFPIHCASAILTTHLLELAAIQAYSMARLSCPLPLPWDIADIR